jgi:predicted MPP superfamily phosphohydrolase
MLALLVQAFAGQAVPYDWRALGALLLTAVYLGCGWYNAHHVWEKDYSLQTDKAVEPLKIALIADSHLGITLDGEDFARELERVQAVNPDIVVVVGDYVDDDTLKADMVEATRALGALETTYGVFFVYGNHDEGYYQYRDFSADELRAELEKNGVTVLADESLPIGESYTLIGRRDRSMRGRADMETLTEDLDRSRYLIVLDHQPNDYDAEADSEADLVVSGHTHGGQMIPFTKAGEWTGAYERAYGYERRKNTDFLVTSGIADWVLLFKTGTKSEYVIVNVTGN